MQSWYPWKLQRFYFWVLLRTCQIGSPVWLPLLALQQSHWSSCYVRMHRVSSTLETYLFWSCLRHSPSIHHCLDNLLSSFLVLNSNLPSLLCLLGPFCFPPYHLSSNDILSIRFSVIFYLLPIECKFWYNSCSLYPECQKQCLPHTRCPSI